MTVRMEMQEVFKERKMVNLVPATFFFITFLFGIIANSLFLWVLGFKMKRAVNIIWFFHLILANFIFTIMMPIIGVYLLVYPQWIFGQLMCKLINTLLSVSMFAAVFLLTIISTDRYLLVVHPLWCRSHRTTKCASTISAMTWVLALVFSAPYLIFRVTRLDEQNRTICYNNYAFPNDWEDLNTLKLKRKVQCFLFVFRFLLGFLLPFIIISFCYLTIASKMKMKSLTKSKKPFKVIIIVIISFLFSWTPYHVYYGLSLYPDHYPGLLNIFKVLSSCLTCINSCFTPILYLFIGENFKQIFRRSIMSLFESAFNEYTNSMDQSYNDRLEISVHSTVKDQI
ncbi:probable G-protein coupled receptor 33 [Microcaecilia unicolor]|uniref:Probable G-protein coupled receptor 33 n=1 Tax=Microcaecilia unicolor TaxID=1415580 RepID=A0A6P7YW81_9AMPH|nr:probable G-protein coupled receptor 33 [Microcaecilia unicolor]